MAVTNAQIDAAVPADGAPNRARTNAVLKGLRDDLAAAAAEIDAVLGETAEVSDPTGDDVLLIRREGVLRPVRLATLGALVAARPAPVKPTLESFERGFVRITDAPIPSHGAATTWEAIDVARLAPAR